MPSDIWKPHPSLEWPLSCQCWSKGCSLVLCRLPTIRVEKAMTPHSSTLAWKIPWMEEPGGVQHGEAKSWIQLSNFFQFSLSCIGEGNGKPLQCSCLENPRDGGAWWAAAYGVAQSQTRLKQLSSSSSCSHEGDISMPVLSVEAWLHSAGWRESWLYVGCHIPSSGRVRHHLDFTSFHWISQPACLWWTFNSPSSELCCPNSYHKVLLLKFIGIFIWFLTFICLVLCKERKKKKKNKHEYILEKNSA